MRNERDSISLDGGEHGTGLEALAALQAEQAEEISLRKDEKDRQEAKVKITSASAESLRKTEEEIAAKKTIYDQVVARLQEIDVENKAPATMNKILARKPSVPDRDRRIMFTVVAIMGALALGLGVAYLGTMFDPTIRGAGDVRHAIHAPFLGQLPKFARSTNLVRDSSPALVEAMRMVRTALFERLRGADERVVLVTSSSPRTGKSTVATLLARSLALVGKRVLLVEADLHRPSLAGYLQIEAKRGLVALLAGDASDRDVICRTVVPRLDVVLAGERTAAFDPELLANGVFSACLRRWKSAYDYVIIDSPPVLPVADARILARQADGTVMVLRSSRCRRPDVVQAYADLSAAGGTLLGTVLVGARQRDGYGYGDGYAYAGYLTNGTKDEGSGFRVQGSGTAVAETES